MRESLGKHLQKSTLKYNWDEIFLVVTAGGVGVSISNITLWTIYIRKIEGVARRVSDAVLMWTHVDVGGGEGEGGVQFTLR